MVGAMVVYGLVRARRRRCSVWAVSVAGDPDPSANYTSRTYGRTGNEGFAGTDEPAFYFQLSEFDQPLYCQK